MHVEGRDVTLYYLCIIKNNQRLPVYFLMLQILYTSVLEISPLDNDLECRNDFLRAELGYPEA